MRSGPSLKSALPLLVSLAASAQGIYNNANSPKDGICPLVQQDKTSLNFGAASKVTTQGRMALRNSSQTEGADNARELGGTTAGLAGANALSQLHFEQGTHLFPRGQRRDVSRFTAYDAKASATSVASLKGQVVLVGLWSTRCDPSAKMLMELAGIYPKADQFKFQILAVNFDLNQQDEGDGAIEGGWRAIHKFTTRNRQFFEASKMPVYTPGLGKEGASNFMDIVQSLPALFVIDRNGQLAAIHIGYKEGFVGDALRQALLEKPMPSGMAAESPKPAQP